MIKTVERRVWAFDAEWVPDPLAGRLLYDTPDSVREPEEILQLMWGQEGATEQDPTPFLKLVKCRLVSIAAVERLDRGDEEPLLRLLSLPRDPTDSAQNVESAVLGKFLGAIGEHKPQLVGFNSVDSDLKIMIQRGVILGLHMPGFATRPAKPWEGIDYFARGGDWHVDIKDLVSGWGKATPSLHELAVQSGIPGKMDVDGNDVARLWLDGELGHIVDYNEYDALTTYLVWLRIAHFAGHFSSDAYEREQALLRAMVEREIDGGDKPHLAAYLEEWDRLRAFVAER